ncbi:MAG: OPT family oligopeptide transporter [Planctomycetaceae bacterium]
MPDNTDEPLYRPDRQERQLTVRAVPTGCLIGSVVSCTNIYVGLKIGWSFGASIISAVLARFRCLTCWKTCLARIGFPYWKPTHCTQTSGSAAGYMSSAAGLLAAIPALAVQGMNSVGRCCCCGHSRWPFWGSIFAVPLRRQMIDVDKLKFPSGTATAETILAMFSDASEALMKSRVLLLAGLYAGLFTLANHFYPVLEAPPLHEWLPLPVLGLLATWTFTVYLGPSLLGAGFLIGPRVVLSLVAGGLLAWGVIGPLAQFQGWAPGPVMSYSDGPRGWILWPGVALMVSEALATLAFSWRTFLNALIMTSAAVADHGSEEETHDPQHIPDAWWMTGLFLGSLLTIGIALVAFGIPWYLTLVAILLSAVLAAVGVRSVGETDINPVGGMGKVTQLVFGGLAPGSITTNLLAAGITAGGASQAADMMQDLKTGKLLGASPRKQFLAQLCGICVGIVFAIPVYFLFTSAYELGSKELPAPAAMAWKAMAELLNQGFSALPPHSLPAIMIATLTGIVIAGLQQIKKLKPYVPREVGWQWASPS